MQEVLTARHGPGPHGDICHLLVADGADMTVLGLTALGLIALGLIALGLTVVNMTMVKMTTLG